jgi:hypothetical protein
LEFSSNVEYLRELHRMNAVTERASEQPLSPLSPVANERRQSQRYKCNGSAEFRTDAADVRTWATITDISRGGCYVEMQATSPQETNVNLQIEVEGIRVHVRGTVRVCYPFLGMGIAFTEISPEERERLESILAKLDRNLVVPATTPPKVEEAASIPYPGAALQSLQEHFEKHSSLNRETFQELVRRSQDTEQFFRR